MHTRTIAALFLLSTISRSSAFPPATVQSLTIARVPELCLLLVQQLDQQTAFEGKGPDLNAESKVLPIANENLCQIFSILNNRSDQIPGVGQTFIKNFSRESQFVSKTGALLSQGIYAKSSINYGGYCRLATDWSAKLQRLSSGWLVAPSELIANTQTRKLLNSWYLFVKPKEDFDHEDLLIRALSFFMDLKDMVRCLKHDAENFSLQLWIKHEAFGRVVRAFDLKIVSES